jgi:hypothetical protein
MAKKMDNNHPLKVAHQPGIKGILHIHGIRRASKKIPLRLAILFTFLTSLLFFGTAKSSYIILSSFIDIGISLLPNLLGFSLGGYALIIGFGNVSLIKSMTRRLSNENGSLFQKLSAIFAFGILLQISSLILTYVAKLIIQFDVSLLPNSLSARSTIYGIVNVFASIVLLFFYYWTLFIIPFIVTNIFSFGQTHHMFLTVEKLKEDKHAASQTPEQHKEQQLH